MVTSLFRSPLKKVDQDQQMVWGEVYCPGYPDSQGDFMSRETIRAMAYDFMRAGRLNKVDHEHSEVPVGATIVESFIARDDDALFVPGSWVVGCHVANPEIWALVKSGEINGFSFGGAAVRTESTIELNIPETLTGKTDEMAGHSHEFIVRYSPEGEFLGGTTTPGPDGHVHLILRGTVTEDAAGHHHRFSFVEGLIDG